MVSTLGISLFRRTGLILLELVIKVIWAVDRLSGLNFGYIVRFFSRFVIFLISLSFLVFLGYSFSTGYLHKLSVEYMAPGYVPLKPARLVYPRKVGLSEAPDVSAISAIAIDRNKERILFEKDVGITLPPASTAKLMSALVAMEIYSPDEQLTVSELCTDVEGTKAWFPKESVFKVKDLIESMLVASAGDSACVLSSSKISEEEFVKKMNSKAANIGMKSTRFANPIGLDDSEGRNFSNVWDLYRLSVYATSKNEIRDAVSKKEIILSSMNGDFSTVLPNTNKLLWEVPHTVGIKTGTTQGAGEVLIYEYLDEIKDIIIIVMGSKDRFGDTKSILNWIETNYEWEFTFR